MTSTRPDPDHPAPDITPAPSPGPAPTPDVARPEDARRASSAPGTESDTGTGAETAAEMGTGAADATRLREEIDRGGAGDKVAFQDPAAAPLGTDDEAAGTPPSRRQVAEATAHETHRDTPEPGKPTAQELQGPEHGKLMKSVPQPVIWVVVGIVVVIILGGLLT